MSSSGIPWDGGGFKRFYRLRLSLRNKEPRHSRRKTEDGGLIEVLQDIGGEMRDCQHVGEIALGQREPQVTLPGGLEPVPMSFRRAQLHCTNTAEPFQLLPTGPLAFPLSSITWGNY